MIARDLRVEEEVHDTACCFMLCPNIRIASLQPKPIVSVWQTLNDGLWPCVMALGHGLWPVGEVVFAFRAT